MIFYIHESDHPQDYPGTGVSCAKRFDFPPGSIRPPFQLSSIECLVQYTLQNHWCNCSTVFWLLHQETISGAWLCACFHAGTHPGAPRGRLKRGRIKPVSLAPIRGAKVERPGWETVRDHLREGDGLRRAAFAADGRIVIKGSAVAEGCCPVRSSPCVPVCARGAARWGGPGR